MGPLEGVRVVELATGIAGPLAGMLLGDYGAEVVKVEPPGGDLARGLPGFAVWNRNKRSVTGEPARLIAGADVCIVGGADPPAGLPENLVVLHVPPYAPGETPWAGGAESHGLLGAISGAARRQSSFDGGPIELVYPFELYEQGVWAAACAVAALIERERSGLGQVVTVAGMHGVMAAMPHSFVADPAQPPAPTNVGPGGRHPTYTTYRCGDGEWLFLAALIPKFQRNAFATLGVGDLFADPRIGGVPNRILLPENRPWVRATLAAAFATKPRDEWLEALEVGDCPAGALYDRDDWLDHPQIVENGLRVEVDDPERGRVVMMAPPIGFSKTPGCVRSPAPRLGEHDATAPHWEPRPRPSAKPRPTGTGPLHGFRILDLGTILAGPYAGSLMAGLGAEVIKVESPSGDPFRETGFVYNRGMRGLAIDLGQPEGQSAFHRLVETADAVIDNPRQGVSQRLRTDYATLAERNPRIVKLSVAGFGERGPLAHKPAFDPVLVAMSGMMRAQGGDSDPAHFTIPVNDVVAAVTVVLGICLGLYHRVRTGEGQRAATSLAASSLTMQSGELVRYAGRPPSPRGGRDYVGPSDADRYYQTSDGWVRVQAPSVDALRSALGAEDLCGAFAALTAEAALERLRAAGIPAAPARQPVDLWDDGAIERVELLAEHHLPTGTPYVVPHRYVRFSRTEQPPLCQSPGIGEHSREVLAEAGLSDAEIGELVERGIVRQGEPFVLKELVNYR